MAAPSPRRRVGYHRLQQPTTASSSDGDGDGDPGVLWLVEDNALVLLGGEVWPSAFAMAEAVEVRMLQSSEPPPSMIVELGAGTGLCGLVAAAAAAAAARRLQQQGPFRVYLTDESPELAAVNAELFRREWLDAGDGGGSAAAGPSSGVTVEALELLWGDADMPPPLAAALASPSSLLVLGCEVTPMAKTQPALVATLRALLLHPNAADATALLTVDACTLRRRDDEAAGSLLEYHYPRICPTAQETGGKPCAGHRFLALVEAEAEAGGFDWAVERVWTAEEARAACHARRVREAGGGVGSSDFGAATAPEGLVLVSVKRKGGYVK